MEYNAFLAAAKTEARAGLSAAAKWAGIGRTGLDGACERRYVTAWYDTDNTCVAVTSSTGPQDRRIESHLDILAPDSHDPCKLAMPLGLSKGGEWMPVGTIALHRSEPECGLRLAELNGVPIAMLTYPQERKKH